MAKRILDLINATAEDSDNLYGDITDDNGSGNGTPMNNASFHDMFVFYQRLMQKGGITPNGLPDNAYNGWQLYQALSGDWNTIGAQGQPAFTNSWASYGSGYQAPRFRRELTYCVLSGAISNAGNNSGTAAFTLPPLFRPLASQAFGNPNVSALSPYIIIANSGAVSITYTGGSSSGFISLEGIRIPLD